MLTRKQIGIQIILPLVAGATVACFSAALLFGMKPIWTLLVLVGIAALIPAVLPYQYLPTFLRDDPKTYWLVLFLLVIPINMQKKFGDKIAITKRLAEDGPTWGTPAITLGITDLPLIILLILWLIHKVRSKDPLYWPAINWVPVAFICWVTLGLFFSAYPKLGILELSRQCKYFLVYLFVTNNVNPFKMGRIILFALMLGLIFESTITLVMYKLGMTGSLFGSAFGSFEGVAQDSALQVVLGDESSAKRAVGTFQNPMILSKYFELVLPLAFLFIWISRDNKKRLFFLSLFLAGTLCLFLTNSRSGLVGFLVGISVVFFICYYRKLISKKTVMVLVLVGLLLSPLIITKIYSQMSTRPSTVTARFDHWRVGFQMVTLNPIMGIGLNTSTYVRIKQGIGNLSPTENLHNYYLVILSETGVLGALLYFGFFSYIFYRAVRLTSLKTPYGLGFSIAIMGSMLSLALHVSLGTFPNYSLNVLLWFYCGIIVAMGRYEADERKQPQLEH
jgi:O-antigen ligase